MVELPALSSVVFDSTLSPEGRSLLSTLFPQQRPLVRKPVRQSVGGRGGQPLNGSAQSYFAVPRDTPSDAGAPEGRRGARAMVVGGDAARETPRTAIGGAAEHDGLSLSPEAP